MQKKRAAALAMLIASMAIYGTIGIFRRYIPVSSGTLAFLRGAVGTMVLILPAMLGKTENKGKILKKNLPLLVLSGALIGVNWILLFEAYNHTTVSVATLCYYMAPVFIIAASPLILGERLRARKAVCLLCAVLGMVLVSGVFGSAQEAPSPVGMLFGLGAAALYASVILLNKKLTDVPGTLRTSVQIGAAALTVLPYVLLTDGMDLSACGAKELTLILLVGVVHTGIAYLLYFSALPHLSAQTAAIFSYIDPVVALLLSAVLLRENLGLTGVLGAVLILGAALVSELKIKNKKNKNNA